MGLGGVRWCGVALAMVHAGLAQAQALPQPADSSSRGGAPLPDAPPPPGPPPPPPSPAALSPALPSEEPSKEAGQNPAAIPQDQETMHWVMPNDAAARHSPFINAVAGGTTIANHFDSSAYLGAEVGAFFDSRIRVSARALFPFGVTQGAPDVLSNPEFLPTLSEKPALIYGAGAGVALFSGQSFVLSLQANYQRTDVGDFGHMLALAVPFEWVTKTGLRVGFEGGVLRAFGGQVYGKCASPPMPFDFGNDQNNLSCDLGEVRIFDRDAGNGVWLHFTLGYPYDRPEPQLVPGQ